MEETLENVDNRPQGVPQAVKTLAIFAYIGNGFWALMLLIIMFMLMGDSSSLERLLGGRILDKGVLTAGLVFVLVLCAVSIIGAMQMAKGKKSGFWMYAISNGLWVLFGFMAGTPQNIGVAAISLGFIIGFGAQLKNMR